jgi:hypothetical protein
MQALPAIIWSFDPVSPYNDTMREVNLSRVMTPLSLPYVTINLSSSEDDFSSLRANKQALSSLRSIDPLLLVSYLVKFSSISFKMSRAIPGDVTNNAENKQTVSYLIFYFFFQIKLLSLKECQVLSPQYLHISQGQSYNVINRYLW